MKSASAPLRFFRLRSAAAAVLCAAMFGCGQEVMSYNRQFRDEGMTQYDKAAYADAASSFSNALRQEPGDYTSRFYLAKCEEKLSQPQRAIEDYRTCLEVMSRSLEGKTDSVFRARVTRALADAIAREPDKTGDLALIERQPVSAENCLLLARIYRQIGDADNALSRFEQAQQLDPKDPEIAKEYGLYLEELGQTQRADKQLRRAYTLNMHDEEVNAALRRLGVVPGPSLAGDDGLAKPVLPLGPLPEVDLSHQPAASASPGGTGGSASAPRD